MVTNIVQSGVSSATLYQAAKLVAEMEKTQAELNKLLGNGSAATSTPVTTRGKPGPKPGVKRNLTPEAKARIAAGQHARWAKHRAEQGK
jgi:hypothetical protein